MSAALVFPHQLYADHPACRDVNTVYVVEDPLFFRQYRFHRQKLMFHRATMKRFAAAQKDAGRRVRYIDSADLPDTQTLAVILKREKVRAVQYVDSCDDWLGRRLGAALKHSGIRTTIINDPYFLTSRAVIDDFAAGSQRLFFHHFYIAQRKRLGLLLDGDQPQGGQWSFDADNRKRLPKGLALPEVPKFVESAAVAEARAYVLKAFPKALGDDAAFAYPTDVVEARAGLQHFVKTRLPHFGDYEDAIHREHGVLFHSMLGPPMNAGLLSAEEVVRAAMDAADEVPLNSLEGFLRQVIGWREFVRLVYLTRGRQQRTRNYWNFTKPMPAAFYDGTTGVEPVDTVIQRVLRTGFCHHIERLMILGNFLMLCEVHPDAVYQWFMELFTDAYDWVMVPNVYGMSQHADGGGMTTKPYLSGSAYVLKMSNYSKGPWCPVWDALYWRFIDNHADFFKANHRTSVIITARDKLGPKLKEHHRIAEAFLTELHGD